MINEYFGLPTKIENLEELNNGLTRVKVYVAYPDENRKKIDIPKEVFNNALNSALGMPIVAHFFSDGKLGGHSDDVLKIGFETRRTGKTYAYGFVDYNSVPQWETIDDVEWITMIGYLFTERFPESTAIISSNQSMEVKLHFSDATSDVKVVDEMSFMALCSLNPKGIEPTFLGSKFVKFSIDESDIYDDEDIDAYYKRMKELFADDDNSEVKPSQKIKKRGRPKKIVEVVNSDIHKELEDTRNNIEINKQEEGDFVDENKVEEKLEVSDFSMTMNTHRDLLEANFKDIAGNDWYYVMDLDENYVYIRREGVLYRYAYDANHVIDANSCKKVVTVTTYVVEGEESVEMSIDEEKKEEMAIDESEKKELEGEEKSDDDEKEESEEEMAMKEKEMGCHSYSLEDIEDMKKQLQEKDELLKQFSDKQKDLEFDVVLSNEEFAILSDEDKTNLKSNFSLSVEEMTEKAEALAFKRVKEQGLLQKKENASFSIGIPKKETKETGKQTLSAHEAVKQFLKK